VNIEINDQRTAPHAIPIQEVVVLRTATAAQLQLVVLYSACVQALYSTTSCSYTAGGADTDTSGTCYTVVALDITTALRSCQELTNASTTRRQCQHPTHELMQPTTELNLESLSSRGLSYNSLCPRSKSKHVTVCM